MRAYISLLRQTKYHLSFRATAINVKSFVINLENNHFTKSRVKWFGSSLHWYPIQKCFPWKLKLACEHWISYWIFKLFRPCITHDMKGLVAQGKAVCYRVSRGKAIATAASEWSRCSAESTAASLIRRSLREAFKEVWKGARLVS